MSKNNYIDIHLNEIFTDKKIKLKCILSNKIKAKECNGCFYKSHCRNEEQSNFFTTLQCSAVSRTEKNSVIFKKIK